MSTETQRAEFEAWFRREHPDWVGQLDRTFAADGGYMHEARRLWKAWQAAQASQAAELAALKADIARQATEIEALRKDAGRLDALEAANFNSAMWLVARGKDSFTVAMKSPYGNCVTRRTLREAIDAAMQTKEAS